MTTDSVIGQNIQEARYRAGMSQADLAERLSVHRSALSRMEAGVRAVTAVELARISAVLDVSVSNLLAPREGLQVSPRTSRLLLRASHVTEDDHQQLNWALHLWSITGERLPPGRHVGPARRPRFLSSAQVGELYADLTREAVGLRAGDSVQGLSKIAMELGVAVAVARMPSRSNVAGCSIMGDGRASLALVNSNHPESRQRFTLAHEIAHHILHRNSEAIACQEAAVRRGRPPTPEFEADVFASAFLMPRRAIRNLARTQPSAPTLLQEIQARFGTSRSATLARLRGLNVITESDARSLRGPVRESQVDDRQPDFRRVGKTLARLAAASGAQELVGGTATRVVRDDKVVL